MLGLPGVFEVLSLIALGVGYVVLYFAKREEKGLQLLGYIIGGVIIGSALAYLLCNLWIQDTICSSKSRYYKGMMQRRMMQPAQPKAPAQKPPVPK